MSVPTKAAGFTLLELLVSVTIAGVILSALMTSYASLLRTRQQVDLQRRVQTQATLALTRMADKVRDYGIDYDRHVTGGDESLALGQDITFLLSDGQLVMEEAGERAPLVSEDILVTGTFTVTPDAPEPLRLHQPRVDVELTFAPEVDPERAFTLRTSLSSRMYE